MAQKDSRRPSVRVDVSGENAGVDNETAGVDSVCMHNPIFRKRKENWKNREEGLSSLKNTKSLI